MLSPRPGVERNVPTSGALAAVDVTPRLRGWLHMAALPLAFLLFLTLLVASDNAVARSGVAVYMLSALIMFGISGVYHTGRWSAGAHRVWKRLDHASIFILIAGSYTPFSLLLLSPAHASLLLSLVWAGAALGVVFRLVWVDAPRIVYVSLYVLLGWAAVLFAGEFVAAAPTMAWVLLAAGGCLYTLGAVVYGLRWPDPWPHVFGFHEVFHTLTVIAFIAHFAGVGVLAVAG